MKLKFNLNMKNQGFKDLVLAHGEKVVMVFVALCVLWMVYGAMGRKGLDATMQPDQLKTLVRTANDTIKQGTAGQLPEPFKPPAAANDMAKIEIGQYTIDVPLNPPEFPPKSKRGDPQLLPVEDLEVAAGVGLFVMRGAKARSGARPGGAAAGPARGKPPARGSHARAEPGGGKEEEASSPPPRPDSRPHGAALQSGGVRVSSDDKVVGRYWAVVLAKVPWVKQQELFHRAFRDAEYYEPKNDVPTYFAYLVERAEMTGGGALKWQRVATITKKKLDAITARWAMPVPPMVDRRYLDDLLTFPLPPLTGRNWNASITHSAVPLAVAEKQPGRGAGGGPAEKDGTGEPDLWGLGASEPLGRPPREGGAKNEGPPAKRPGSARLRRAAGTENTVASRPADAAIRLFRFFDFSVEPGHRYQYRVRLVLLDPNNLVAPRFLDDSVLKRRAATPEQLRKYVLTTWSKPSPTVLVPFPGQIFAGPVKAVRPGQYYFEPTARVLVKMLNVQAGVEGIAELEKMRRGTVGNFKRSTEVIDPALPGGGTRKMDDFPFQTNTTLLDMRGGIGLSTRNKALTEPGELLLLDPLGQLMVRSEVKDHDQYAQYARLLNSGNPRSDRRGGKKSETGRSAEEGSLFDRPERGGRRGRLDRGRPGRGARDRNPRDRSRGGRPRRGTGP